MKPPYSSRHNVHLPLLLSGKKSDRYATLLPERQISDYLSPLESASVSADKLLYTSRKILSFPMHLCGNEEAGSFHPGYLSPYLFFHHQNMLHATVRPAITIATMLINLIKMFKLGPDVSLNGSPTVSPTTVAL